MFMKLAVATYNETAARGDGLLEAAAVRRLPLFLNSSYSAAHSWQEKALRKAKIL
jgi:hypothetical protein